MAKTAKSNGENAPYKVPSQSGNFILADPIKFCLRFRPPTIAIVYQV